MSTKKERDEDKINTQNFPLFSWMIEAHFLSYFLRLHFFLVLSPSKINLQSFCVSYEVIEMSNMCS